MEQSKYSFLPESTIFVVNKWDMVSAKTKENFLRIVTKELKKRWPMFRPHQLLTLNAKRAEMVWFNTGKLTPDLKAVCTAITNIIPGSFNNFIIKPLRHVG